MRNPKILFISIAVCIVIGVCCIIYPMVHYEYEAKQIEKTLSMKPISNKTSETKTMKNQIPFPGTPEDVLGKIKVPSVSIELSILNGATDENLKVGATTLRENQKMGKDNYSLAGHHMKKEDLLFGRIDDIEINQSIFLTDYQYIYQYRVSNKELVDDTQTEILDDHGINEITLITCDKPTATEKRTVIHGLFKKKFIYSDKKWEELN
ncbi:class A sortase [Bacillus velezensis]